MSQPLKPMTASEFEQLLKVAGVLPNPFAKINNTDRIAIALRQREEAMELVKLFFDRSEHRTGCPRRTPDVLAVCICGMDELMDRAARLLKEGT